MICFLPLCVDSRGPEPRQVEDVCTVSDIICLLSVTKTPLLSAGILRSPTDSCCCVVFYMVSKGYFSRAVTSHDSPRETVTVIVLRLYAVVSIDVEEAHYQGTISSILFFVM